MEGDGPAVHAAGFWRVANCCGWSKPLMRNGTRDPTGKTPDAASRRFCENILLSRNSDLSYVLLIPARREGRSYVVTIREPGLRWTRQRRAREVRAGRIAFREPETACRRAALRVRLASIFPAMSTARENPVAISERAYGKTVWSWPSLLRSSLCGDACEPNRADGIVNSRGEGGQRNSAPGRARHKPSNHRAGKAACWASPVCCCAVSLRYLSRSGPRVLAGTRPSLRPLD